MLNFLQGKLNLEQIGRLERQLQELRGEEIGIEYWSEVFQYPYDLSNEESEKVAEEYNIIIIEDI